MSYNQPLKPRKSTARKWTEILLAFLAATVVIACCGWGIALAIGTDNDTLKGTPPVRLAEPGIAATGTAPAPAPAPKSGRSIEPGDIKLGVKTTDKECFGGVVCNVEFKLTVDVSADLLERSDKDWTVTYEVSGVKDGPQIGTLTLRSDGTFEQDAYQFGQTPNKSTKLKAKVTDVEPVL